nr:immunoglobulin light chain junction region [Macaca mulatta]MOX17156.1 immunoglobulin light chain junction region [Macaca mulatta]MOX17537.1 immunoglobulin light chain junction region [Macaca mulatta]MOX17880.1 immunoglobulin light chain junction region [Macaca mulatta]MOX17892.1 immunoglobulin light chain junction region [Macaca mulatta]
DYYCQSYDNSIWVF